MMTAVITYGADLFKVKSPVRSMRKDKSTKENAKDASAPREAASKRQQRASMAFIRYTMLFFPDIRKVMKTAGRQIARKSAKKIGLPKKESGRRMPESLKKMNCHMPKTHEAKTAMFIRTSIFFISVLIRAAARKKTGDRKVSM
jgi:hypothetical protein